MRTARMIISIGTVTLMLAVLIGAFGAHALAPLLELNQRTDTFETASRYHFYHGFALLIVGVLIRSEFKLGLQKIIVVCFLLGILLFSGSLYCLAIFDISWLGAITPIGGGLFLLGWSLLAWTTWNSKSRVGVIDNAQT